MKKETEMHHGNVYKTELFDFIIRRIGVNYSSFMLCIFEKNGNFRNVGEQN